VNHLLFSYHTCPMEEPGTGLSGGMNVFLRGLLPGLAGRGFRTDVFTRGKGTDVEITSPFDGVRILHLPCGWRDPPSRESAYDALPRFARRARELLDAGGPAYDVVTAHYWMSGIACLEAGMRPQAFTYHTIEARKAGAAAASLPGLSSVRREAEERLAGEVFRVVCFSEDDLAGTIGIFPAVEGKGTVIQPGVDDAFRDLTPRAEARLKRDIPDGAFLFLLAARPDPGKNVALAFEAFRALRAEEGDRLRLIVAGQEIPEALLPGGAACAGAVPHAEMPALFSAADAVLCPSSYESFGLVPLEAMAAGRPVIVPGGGFWGDTVTREGGGVAYAPGAKAGLAVAMRAVCRDTNMRERLAEEGKRIAARFTWEKCTESWASLLSGVARPGNRR
jgi:D-inositol-3-phosphate glycosyltransferase